MMAAAARPPMVDPIQPDFAAALLDPDKAVPDGLVAWNGSDPATRFGIYRNNVLASLVMALRAKFTVSAQLVGDEFFNAMAALYVRQAPPTSRLLMHYGETFPDFIARFEPARTVPYLADTARLEAARIRVYHAADAAPLATDRLAQLMSGDIGSARFSFHPAFGLVSSDFAIFSLYAAHQGAKALRDVDPFQPEAVVIARPMDDVDLALCDPGEAAFLEQLFQGNTLAEATESAMSVHFHFDLTRALHRLFAGGWVTDFSFSSGPHA
jgi:Putative DNA-binding domain